MAGEEQMKLIYFDLRGRAEFARLLLAKAGVQYCDHRINKEEWSELKPKTPWGQLPVLSASHGMVGGSIPIARFIANKYGLAGKNECDIAIADSMVSVMYDYIQMAVLAHFAQDEAVKEKATKAAEEFKCNMLCRMEKMLEKNGGNFLVGSCMTWADISLLTLYSNDLDCQEERSAKVAKDYPKLWAHIKQVAADPGIAKWIKERPKTAM